MQGGGAILAHQIIAEVDEGQPNEFGDIQYLDVAETGEASTDARQKRTNGNEDVAEKSRLSPLLPEILDGRINGPAKEKDEGVEVEQGRKSPDPLPGKHAPREAVIEAFGKL